MSEQARVSVLAVYARLFSAFSLLCLAAALAYMAHALTTVSNSLPQTLDKFQQSADVILPLIDQTGEIVELVPEILAESQKLREQFPAILGEVAAVREVVPDVLKEVALTREALPSVLTEVKATREAIPAVLEEVRLTRKTVPLMLRESAAVRAEVDKVLEAVPPTLTRVEGVVQHADDVVAKLGQNAVKNVLTGIVEAPVSIISEIGSKLKLTGLDTTDSENKLIVDTFTEMVKNGKTGDARHVRSRRTGFSADITLMEKLEDRERRCYLVNIVTQRKGGDSQEADYHACQQPDQRWEVVPVTQGAAE